MTKAVGFDERTGSLVIMGNGVFPAGSLIAYPSPWPGRIQIDSIASRGEQIIEWHDVRRLDPDDPWQPASLDEALAYLHAEFSKRSEVSGDYAIPVAIKRAGQTTIPLQQPPTRLSTVRLEINGLTYRAPEIAASDVAVTWMNPDFPLDPSDRVTVVYS